jgi:hypothetical protein
MLRLYSKKSPGISKVAKEGADILFPEKIPCIFVFITILTKT